MHEGMSKAAEVNMEAVRRQVLESLEPAIQSEIKRLEDMAPDSEVTKFFLKTLDLRRAEKIIKIDGILNLMGRSIGSLNVIESADEAQAVKNIEIMVSLYHEESDKNKAKNELKDLFDK